MSDGVKWRVQHTEISADQCRGARGLLDWTVAELAVRSQVSPRTIARIERGEASTIPSTMKAIVQALEAAGIVFEAAEEGQRVTLMLRGGQSKAG